MRAQRPTKRRCGSSWDGWTAKAGAGASAPGGPAGAGGGGVHHGHRDDRVQFVRLRGRRGLAEPLGDDLPPLLYEGGEELLLWDDADDLALAEDGALPLAGGQADIGVAGLAGAVHHAAYDGHRDRLAQLLEVRLHLVRQGDEVHLDAAAGRAGDDRRAALPDVQRAEDVPGHRQLLDRVGGQGDAERIAETP